MSSIASDRPDETVYAGKSQASLFLTLIVGAVIGGAVTVGIGLGTEWGARFPVGPWAGRDVALLLGGVAALVAVCGAFSWYGVLRWVALSRDGIRWCRGGRTHFRTWDEVAEVKHVTFQIRGTSGPARWVEVHFHSGPYLHLSDTVVEDYEQLITAIETGPRGRFPGPAAGRFLR
jgi:hypothetical protein